MRHQLRVVETPVSLDAIRSQLSHEQREIRAWLRGFRGSVGTRILTEVEINYIASLHRLGGSMLLFARALTTGRQDWLEDLKTIVP